MDVGLVLILRHDLRNETGGGVLIYSVALVVACVSGLREAVNMAAMESGIVSWTFQYLFTSAAHIQW